MKRLCALAVLGFILSVPAAYAEKKPIDFTSCRSGTSTVLSASKELTVLSIELKGIDRSNTADKTFENFTHRCIGVVRVSPKKPMANGYCKYVDPDGDFWVAEWSRSQPVSKGGDWSFIQGTGKWKGIKGGGKYRNITRGKPIVKGTFQVCALITGIYELPK